MKWVQQIVIGFLGFTVLVGAEEFVSATISNRLSGFSDDNFDGCPDSLMEYLIDSGVTLPNPYDPNTSNFDGDYFTDFEDWLLFLDPLVAETNSGSSGVGSYSSTGVVMRVKLPPWIRQYAELYGKESLVDENSQWRPIEEWMPTFGEQTVELELSTESNRCFFVKPFDATWDFDGDGRSDFHEYLTQTDQAVFDYVDSEPDGLHDWWEIKLFGDLSQSGTDDFDGDTLLNNEELVWLSTSNIVMLSDPSLYDSDNDALSDAEELLYATDPMESDTDHDGLKDGAELSGRTDPLNPDTVAPIVFF